MLPCLHLPTAGDLVGTPLSSDLRIGRDPLCRERHLAWIYSLREEAGLPAVWSNLLVTAMYLYTCLREHVLWTDTPACYSSGNFSSRHRMFLITVTPSCYSCRSARLSSWRLQRADVLLNHAVCTALLMDVTAPANGHSSSGAHPAIGPLDKRCSC